MVRRDMERDLALYGGVSNIGPLAPVDPATQAPQKKILLYLTCRRFDATSKSVCGETWEAEAFTPCPKCGNRQFVSKAERPKPVPEVTEAVDPLGAI